MSCVGRVEWHTPAARCPSVLLSDLQHSVSSVAAAMADYESQKPRLAAKVALARTKGDDGSAAALTRQIGTYALDPAD